MKKLFFVLVPLLLFQMQAQAQKFLWEAEFHATFDNREYVKLDAAPPSQTLFGAFLVPQVGVGIGKHKVMLGGSIMRNFGQKSPVFKGVPMLYYNYDSDRFKAYAGAFPAYKLKGNYASIMYSDDLAYFDPTIEGCILQYTHRKGFVEVSLDWLSMLEFGKSSPEVFNIYTASRWNFDWFFLGYAAIFNHYVCSSGVGNVIDNDMVVPFVGLDFSDLTFFDRFDIQLGWVQTFQRDRYHSSDFIFPHGAKIDVAFEKWNVGINNILYLGQDVMPFYYDKDYQGSQYGAWVYSGEPFYHTGTGLYDRVEVYWRPFSNEYFHLDLTARFHFDGEGHMGTQQLAKVSLNLNNFTLDKLIQKKKTKDKTKHKSRKK